MTYFTGVRFDWRRREHPSFNFPKGRQLGMIAQEVKEIVSEAVIIDQNGDHSIAYSALVPVLVEAVKELRAQKDAEIDALRVKNAELEMRLARIEGVLAKLNGGVQ